MSVPTLPKMASRTRSCACVVWCIANEKWVRYLRASDSSPAKGVRGEIPCFIHMDVHGYALVGCLFGACHGVQLEDGGMVMRAAPRRFTVRITGYTGHELPFSFLIVQVFVGYFHCQLYHRPLCSLGLRGIVHEIYIFFAACSLHFLCDDSCGR